MLLQHDLATQQPGCRNRRAVLLGHAAKRTRPPARRDGGSTPGRDAWMWRTGPPEATLRRCSNPPPPGFASVSLIAPEVADALRAGRPVVALESTLISHGLPYPRNLEVAGAAEAAVRESGAIPATVAIRGGRLLVGLDAADARGAGHRCRRPEGGPAHAGGSPRGRGARRDDRLGDDARGQRRGHPRLCDRRDRRRPPGGVRDGDRRRTGAGAHRAWTCPWTSRSWP